MKTSRLLSTICLALLPLVASPAAAAVFSWGVTGPGEVMQGQAITVTVAVSASGALNTDHPDPQFIVDTSYTIGGASATPAVLGMPPFTRTEQYNPQGKRQPDRIDGSGSVDLTLFAPAGLAPGDYDVLIAPSTTTGMGLDPSSVTHTVTVTPAAAKPIITILSPASGSAWLYGAGIPVSIEVDDQGCALVADPTAELDDVIAVSLGLDPLGAWAGVATGLLPGPHVLTVSATNGAGTTVAESFFDVYVNFGQWLPPISLNKVRKSGSTLPVKFSLLGAAGPVDVLSPHVLLNGVDLGPASLLYESDGSPYYQLEVKVPAAGTHTIAVADPDMSPPTVSKSITSR